MTNQIANQTLVKFKIAVKFCTIPHMSATLKCPELGPVPFSDKLKKNCIKNEQYLRGGSSELRLTWYSSLSF